MDWRAVARRMHPDALARFHALIDRLVEVDGATTLDLLLPGLGLDEYRALGSEQVVVRALAALRDRAAGLLHALVVREVEVIGTVRGPPDRAYVVYRSTALLSGAVSEIRVMTLRRRADRWAVLESPELEVIRESFRGAPRRARPSGDADPGR